MTRYMALALILAACGGDDGGTMQQRDAAPSDGQGTLDGAPSDAMAADAPIDAQAFVLAVQCDGSEAETVTTTADVGATAMFVPDAVTIDQDEVVKFVMPNTHNVVPDPSAAMTDPGLRVNFNETKCLQFTATGTFGYKCGPHSFQGSVTVQ